MRRRILFSPVAVAAEPEGPADDILQAGLAWWAAPHKWVGFNDSDPVTSVEDSSSGGVTTTQADAAKRGTYETNVQNGLPALLLDAGQGYPTDLAITSGEYTFHLVSKKTSTSARRTLAGSNNWTAGAYAGTWDFYDGNFRTGAPASVVGECTLITVVRGATQTKFYIDGVLISTQANGSYPGTVSLGIVNPFAEPAYAYVCEIAFYLSALADVDREANEAILLDRWGI